MEWSLARVLCRQVPDVIMFAYAFSSSHPLYHSVVCRFMEYKYLDKLKIKSIGSKSVWQFNDIKRLLTTDDDDVVQLINIYHFCHRYIQKGTRFFNEFQYEFTLIHQMMSVCCIPSGLISFTHDHRQVLVLIIKSGPLQAVIGVSVSTQPIYLRTYLAYMHAYLHS